MAYLSMLETNAGDRLMFHRLGSIIKDDSVSGPTMVDVFEAVSYPGNKWFIFYLDFYHPRRSKATPDGFKFTEKLIQFSGFNKFMNNFPYSFVEFKNRERESGLSVAYIPISMVSAAIEKRIFIRPSFHEELLKTVKSKLTFPCR